MAPQEYLPITGFPDFTKQSIILAYGADSAPLKENRVSVAPGRTCAASSRSGTANDRPRVRLTRFPPQIAVTQSISGTGALRIGAAFVSRFYPHSKAVYMPAPTWGNHIPIAKDSGLEVKTYSYYDKKTVGLDFEGFKADLRVRAAHCRPSSLAQ